MNKAVFEKVKACANVNEVLELAKQHGKNITEEEATRLFKYAHNEEGELSENELDNVSGGASGCDRNGYELVSFKRKEDVTFVAKVGDYVEVFVNETGVGNETYTGLVESRLIYHSDVCGSWYYDHYQIQNIKTGFTRTLCRDSIEKK